MDQGVLPVILCGGSGSRLWPLSTAAQDHRQDALVHPSALLKLPGNHPREKG